MPDASIVFNGNAFINRCHQYDIDPDPTTSRLSGWAVYDEWIIFYNDQAGGTNRPSRFVLFSTKLASKVIAGVVALLKDKEVPSGFSVYDALFYRTVYAVGSFDPQVIAKLQSAGIQVDQGAPFDTPANLRQYLRNVIP